MAQSVWMAVPTSHRYKIVDITGQPEAKAAALDEIATAPNGEGAIVAAVAHAARQQRRITSITKFNMDILLIVD
jgi:hypothetical protein